MCTPEIKGQMFGFSKHWVAGELLSPTPSYSCLCPTFKSRLLTRCDKSTIGLIHPRLLTVRRLPQGTGANLCYVILDANVRLTLRASAQSLSIFIYRKRPNSCTLLLLHLIKDVGYLRVNQKIIQILEGQSTPKWTHIFLLPTTPFLHLDCVGVSSQELKRLNVGKSAFV